jgi:hypothetical protein
MFLPIISIAALTYMFAVIDRTIAVSGYQKPYFAVHVLHNAAIVAATTSDVLVSFADFGRLTSHPVTWSAVYLCYALHLYHCLLYWRAFHVDDWLHHGLMIGVALPLGSTVPAGPLMGMNLFFTTGLPGGVSYALLFAEKNRWITQWTSRRWNARVNLWIRSPGCMAMAALALVATISSPSATVWEKGVTWTVAALTAWNGQYFMEQVLTATALSAASSNILEAGKADVSRTVLLPNAPNASEGPVLREQPLFLQDVSVLTASEPAAELPQQ